MPRYINTLKEQNRELRNRLPHTWALYNRADATGNPCKREKRNSIQKSIPGRE